jgi:hypothetical protein
MSPLGRPPGQPLFLLLAALTFVATPAFAEDKTEPSPVVLSSKAVQLDPDDPTRQRIGRLTWRGGIEIASGDSRFGGFSGLLVSADGAELLAVSDKGRWLAANLRYGAEGRLIGIADARMARLRDLDGDALSKNRWRDAESLALLADGSVLVGFEHKHRIWHYTSKEEPLSGRPTAWPKPKGLGDAPKNSGLEAIVALADGRLLALTEDHEDGPGKAGYLWHGEAWSRVTYRHIRPGAELRGEELARWGLPLTVDNFEALATRRGPDGETLVYLLSDDNFSFLQRTLLLMFALEDG